MFFKFHCRRIAPLLTAYAEGDLDERRDAQVAAHLAVCADCRRQVDEITDLGNLLRAHPPAVPDLAPDLWSRIQAEITAEPQFTPVPSRPVPVRPQWASFGLSFAGAGAAMAVIAAGVVFLFPMKHPAATGPGIAEVAKPTADTPAVIAGDVSKPIHIVIRSLPRPTVPPTAPPRIAAVAPVVRPVAPVVPTVRVKRHHSVSLASTWHMPPARRRVMAIEAVAAAGPVIAQNLPPKATTEPEPIMPMPYRGQALPPGAYRVASADEDAGIAPRTVSASPDAALRLHRQQILFSYSGR